VPVLEKHAEEGLEEAGAPAAVPVPTSPPVPVDPLPLVVVLGRAPAVSELFAARARTDTKERVLGEKAKTQDAETKAVDDIGRRFEEFFTAQVADMTQVAAPAGGAGGAKKARSGQPTGALDLAKEAQRDRAAGWLQVADVRLLRLLDEPAASTAVVDRGEASTWIERDWLVEGTRQDVAALLGRLATFTEAVQLQLRTGETTDAKAANRRQQVDAAGQDFFLGQPASDRQRIVLRFRLQPR
jgi:hypothetical protein